MNMRHTSIHPMTLGFLALACCLYAAGCAHVPLEPTPLEALPEADADGWISLFDGETLEGWWNARRPDHPHFWTAEDGVMTNDPDNGRDISTVANFKDFELEIDYKTVPEGNSGVYLRGRVEVQVLDSYGKEEVEDYDTGAVYGQYPPLVNASLPPGEWHTFYIRYVGDTLTVKLNDQLVQDNVTIERVTGGALRGGVNEAGPLMLQGDHGKVWYRNIRIRPIGLE